MPVQSIEPEFVEGIPVSVRVTFICRNGSTRVYEYVGVEAIAITAGADPSQFSGTRIS